ncbi:MAG: hypothetical protein H0X24_02060 [Ktedonobacterales bacterium]|nr:hypothetical protein [Ktedonobacterales bacterium]
MTAEPQEGRPPNAVPNIPRLDLMAILDEWAMSGNTVAEWLMGRLAPATPAHRQLLLHLFLADAALVLELVERSTPTGQLP